MTDSYSKWNELPLKLLYEREGSWHLLPCILLPVCHLWPCSHQRLEGQICADMVLCHIADACQWREDQRNVPPACTSSCPDGPASSPLASTRSRCEREQASPGNLEDVWPSRAFLDRPPHPPPPIPSLQPLLSRLIPQASAQLHPTSGHIGWHLEHTAFHHQ